MYVHRAMTCHDILEYRNVRFIAIMVCIQETGSVFRTDGWDSDEKNRGAQYSSIPQGGYQ